MKKESNVYIENGYSNRTAYLETLAEEYGADMHTVKSLAGLLGESEDFDGLVSALEEEFY